jgi:hypothetical protein
MQTKPRHVVVALLAGLIIGMGIDRAVVRSGGAANEDQPTPRSALAAGAGGSAMPSSDPVQRVVRSNLPNEGGGPTPTPVESKKAAAARESELRAQIQDLQASLDRLKAEADPLVVPPLPRPANLAPRFQEKALTQAAMELVREINPTAEVTAVDCTEYPCIVYGSGFTIDQAKSIRSAAAFEPYRDDHGNIGVSNNTFSFWMVPKDDPNPLDAIDQRTSIRTTAMSAGTRSR